MTKLTKILFPVFLLMICSVSKAQFQKGEQVWGIQLNMAQNDWYTTRIEAGSGFGGHYRGFNFVPTYGYALTKHWLVGGEIFFGLENQTISDGFYNGTIHDVNIALMPNIKYYQNILKNGKLRVYGRAALELIWRKYTAKPALTFADPNDQYTHLIGAIGGGIAYCPGKWMFDASMSNSALRLGAYISIFPKKK